MVYAYLPDELYYTENSGEYERGNLLLFQSLPLRSGGLRTVSPARQVSERCLMTGSSSRRSIQVSPACDNCLSGAKDLWCMRSMSQNAAWCVVCKCGRSPALSILETLHSARRVSECCLPHGGDM